MATTRAKDPKIVAESQKIFRVIKKIVIGLFILFLVLAVVRWGQKKAKEAEATAKKQQIAAPVQWQLCWEKTPEHRGKTAIRRNCNSAVVERQDEILVVKYNFSGGQGVIIASKTPDGAYLGTWRDSTGSGNIFLRFVSPSSALGWQDDGKGTEKDPTSLSPK
jgi:hypothetical protein